MKELVAPEQAKKEIEGWLEYKKISNSKREAYKENIETLVNAVVDGIITVDDKFNLTHTLKFKTDGDAPIEKLIYKPRISIRDVHANLNGVKPSDADGRLVAYVAALTGQPKGVIKALDTEDYAIGQAIAIFFL